MPAYAVIGGQFGDEGKGKVVDFLASDARVLNPEIKGEKPAPVDIVGRFQGGNNAGHTTFGPSGEIKRHLLPCGIEIPDVRFAFLGPRVIINPAAIYNDDPQKPGDFQVLNAICGFSLEDLVERLLISKKASLAISYHVGEDIFQEALRESSSIGTTMQGIGPAITDRVSRTYDLRVGDLLKVKNRKEFHAMLVKSWNAKYELFVDYYAPKLKKVYQERFGSSPNEWIAVYNRVIETFNSAIGKWEDVETRMLDFKERFHLCFVDLEYLLYEANKRGENILFEGAQGFLLDIDHGTTPYVTSSNCGMSAAYSCGITKFDKVIGVMKAYSTRVDSNLIDGKIAGHSPFPTEMRGEEEKTAEHIRSIANEYGVTTGRPRRIGWFDYPAANYFVMLNGPTHLVLTRLDIFDDASSIKVGVGYDCVHDHFGKGKAILPIEDLYCQNFNHVMDNGEVRAVLEELDGWAKRGYKVHGKMRFESLPEEAQKFCRDMEEKTKVPLLLVSTGAKRHETIVMASQ